MAQLRATILCRQMRRFSAANQHRDGINTNVMSQNSVTVLKIQKIIKYVALAMQNDANIRCSNISWMRHVRDDARWKIILNSKSIILFNQHSKF